jgi:hypothetical protein
MTNRTAERRAQSRAEARRRARMAARGEIDESEDQAEADAGAEAERPAESGGFLRRLFPKVPPLPDKPDPLKGFDEEGPMRPIRVRVFLLRQNLLAWTITGILAGFAFYASLFYATNVLGFLGTFGLFGAVIAAGWMGWQRPTLFGTAAALVGYVLTVAVVLWTLAQIGVTPDDSASGTAGALTQLMIQALYVAGIGFLGGWYGGYLRRRNAQVNAQMRRRRR